MTHASLRWFSQNRSQKDDRCLIRKTLVLSVRGKRRSLLLPAPEEDEGMPVSHLLSSCRCCNIMADKLSSISGWNLGEDIALLTRGINNIKFRFSRGHSLNYTHRLGRLLIQISTSEASCDDDGASSSRFDYFFLSPFAPNWVSRITTRAE